MPEFLHLPIDDLLFKEPVTAGMNIYVVASLAHYYRSCNEHTIPITVRRDGDHWRIMDGRHRVVASMMAGRKTVLALEETQPPTPATP